MSLQTALVVGACLACGFALAQATPSEVETSDAVEPARTGICWSLDTSPSHVLPQERLTLENELGSVASRSRPLALKLASSSRLQGWAKGTLLRAQLSADTSLTLRLRGGKLGLYLAVRLTGNE